MKRGTSIDTASNPDVYNRGTNVASTASIVDTVSSPREGTEGAAGGQEKGIIKQARRHAGRELARHY